MTLRSRLIAIALLLALTSSKYLKSNDDADTKSVMDGSEPRRLMQQFQQQAGGQYPTAWSGYGHNAVQPSGQSGGVYQSGQSGGLYPF